MSFPTDHTPRAVGWAAIETLVRQGCQFAAVMVLARILTPSDFGLIAMLSIFTAFAGLLANSGFATALVQQRAVTLLDASTVFWFNLVSGLAIALLLGLCAPLIANFYDRSELFALTWAMALNVCLASLTTVHCALLTRKLDFRTQAIASGISNLTAALVALVLALRGAGVWALATQTLCVTAINGALLWWLHPWRPSAAFSISRLRKLFGFGGFMLASALIDAFSTRIYAVLIGKLYSGRELGLYAQAASTRDVSQRLLGTIFSRVALPVLSRHRDDAAALRARLRSANQLTMAVNLPSMLGLAAVAEVAIPTLFGRQWQEAIPILQILCIAGAIHPLHITNLQVLLAQGRTALMFNLEVIKKSIMIASLLIAAPWGLQAIAWATVVGSVIAFFINGHYSRTLIKYGPISQIGDLWAYLALTASMIAVVIPLNEGLAWVSPGKRFAIDVLSGAVFYIGVATTLRLPAIAFATSVLRTLTWRSRN